MTIYNLMYVSDVRIDGERDKQMAVITDILAIARSKNASVDVTRALLFTEGKFVQVLEGEQSIVKSTFERILPDPRHTNVEVISAQLSERRRFKEWSMAFVGDNEDLRQQFADAPLSALGKRPSGDALLDFMLELAQTAKD